MSVCLQGQCSERKRAVCVSYTDCLSLYKDITVKESDVSNTECLSVYKDSAVKESGQ